MIVTLIVPTLTFPVGGVRTFFEFANGLARRGDQVHLVHLRMPEHAIDSPDQIDWFSFAPGITHHLTTADDDFTDLPVADFIAPSEEVIRETLRAIRGRPGGPYPAQAGRAFNLVQGYGMLWEAVEHAMFTSPHPTLMVAHWLVDLAVDMGVPRERLVLVPNGIDLDRFRITRPIEGRPPQVAMLYHAHFMKGTSVGLDALWRAKASVPTLTATLFGTSPPPVGLPDWITTRQLPDQATLVDEIYNGSSVMVCPAVTEGFGVTNVEAMACGCALATTANGGARDYAFPGTTALVSDPKDAVGLGDNIITLLTDPALRCALAHQGAAYVQRYTWEHSVNVFLSFMDRYRDDPESFPGIVLP